MNLIQFHSPPILSQHTSRACILRSQSSIPGFPRVTSPYVAFTIQFYVKFFMQYMLLPNLTLCPAHSNVLHFILQKYVATWIKRQDLCVIQILQSTFLISKYLRNTAGKSLTSHSFLKVADNILYSHYKTHINVFRMCAVVEIPGVSFLVLLHSSSFNSVCSIAENKPKWWAVFLLYKVLFSNFIESWVLKFTLEDVEWIQFLRQLSLFWLINNTSFPSDTLHVRYNKTGL